MKKQSENYLDRKPIRNEKIQWSEKSNVVTLQIENKGIFNLIAQKLFKKPRISYVDLDEYGSFIWPNLDGEKTIFELGKDLKLKFGEAANPLYERLCKYIKILNSYGFIEFK